jgi:hypothetical protein
MKSTYSVIVIASVGWQAGMYELHMEFPAMPDQEALEVAIESIESQTHMLEKDLLMMVFIGFDDEPNIRVKRLFNIGVSAYGKAVHGLYENDEEMYALASDSVQPSVCRNCGEEGPSLEPDGRNGWCDSCGQNACLSLAVCLGVM